MRQSTKNLLPSSSRFLLSGMFLTSLLTSGVTALPVFAITTPWVRQLGTAADDAAIAVSNDGMGNVYLSGQTGGSLGGTHAGGFGDAFVTKLDAAGNLEWSRQLGTSGFDWSLDVSADGLGSVYITGATDGSLGGPNAGFDDAFLAKYDEASDLLWTRQLGTASTDFGYGISADGVGNVYITGNTNGSLAGPNYGSQDVFLGKYSQAGDLQWVRQLGTPAFDVSNGVSADGIGNIYISGYTAGSLEGSSSGSDDAFVAKYDSLGNLLWVRQLGTSSTDRSNGVSADSLGNVFLSGATDGSLGSIHAGSFDAVVAKYNSDGDLIWVRQLGTAAFDVSTGVSADSFGNVFISGGTAGSLGGSNAGGQDAFAIKYDAVGNRVWTRSLGTNAEDSASDVSVDSVGNVYVSGFTRGSLGGSSAGGSDAFVAHYFVPEPSALALTVVAAGILTTLMPWPRHHRRRQRSPRMLGPFASEPY